MIDGSDVIVVGNQAGSSPSAVLECQPGQVILDLVRLPVHQADLKAEYSGVELVACPSGTLSS